jgi:hypothetical protein
MTSPTPVRRSGSKLGQSPILGGSVAESLARNRDDD